MLKKITDYLIFSIMSAGIGFFTITYMTKVISPEEFGVVGLFMAVLYVLPQLISFVSIGLISINKVKMTQEMFLEFSRSYFTFGMIIFVILFFLSLSISTLYEKYFYIFVLVPIIAFIQYLALFHNAELIQDGKSRKYGIYRLALTLMSLILTMIFISYFKLSWDGRLYAMLASELFVLFLTIKFSFKTLRNFKLDFDIKRFKEYYLFGLPLLFWLAFTWILNQADRYIVLEFFTLKDVGIYTVAYSIGTIVNTVNQAATNAIVPILYKNLEKKEANKIVKKLNIYYSLAIITIALIVGLSSYWYVPLLFGNEYSQSASIILFIALAFGFNGVYRVTGSVIAFYKYNKLQMNLLFISAIINILLSIVMIPFFGILSPAISTMIAYMVLAYLSYINGWKILRKEEKC
jgi:O-antigen/teichoic acid export membrane protein